MVPHKCTTYIVITNIKKYFLHIACVVEGDKERQKQGARKLPLLFQFVKVGTEEAK